VRWALNKKTTEAMSVGEASTVPWPSTSVAPPVPEALSGTSLGESL
jgi:hypothetical protein